MTDTSTSLAAAPRPSRIEVMAPTSIMDTGKFEHMQRVAALMARATMIPDHLHSKAVGTGNTRTLEPFSFETVMANCFMIVNQADRWKIDPFMLAQVTSIVNGRLCYEGKLIAALIEDQIGIRLAYAWNDKTGDDLAITVSGQYDDEDEPRVVHGTVAAWKTGQWGTHHSDRKKRLAYRGAREWARLHSPSVLLGIYSDDDMEELRQEVAARRAVPISERLSRAQPAPAIASNGFDRAALQQRMAVQPTEHVDKETGEVTAGDVADEQSDAAAPTGEQAVEDIVPPTEDQTPSTADIMPVTEGDEQPSGDLLATAGSGPPSDPKERAAYYEGIEASEKKLGPQVPRKYAYVTTKHLSEAWTRGYREHGEPT